MNLNLKNELHWALVAYMGIVKLHIDVVTGITNLENNDNYLKTIVATVLLEISSRTVKQAPVPGENELLCNSLFKNLRELNKNLSSLLFIIKSTNDQTKIDKLVVTPLKDLVNQYMAWMVNENQFYDGITRILDAALFELVDDQSIHAKVSKVIKAILTVYHLLMVKSPTPYIIHRMFTFLTQDIEQEYNKSLELAKQHVATMENIANNM